MVLVKGKDSFTLPCTPISHFITFVLPDLAKVGSRAFSSASPSSLKASPSTALARSTVLHMEAFLKAAEIVIPWMSLPVVGR